LEFGEEGGSEAAFAELEGGFEVLAEAAEAGFLGAGQRELIHGWGTVDRGRGKAMAEMGRGGRTMNAPHLASDAKVG